MDRSTAPIATAHAQCVRSKLLASTCGLLMLAGCAGGVSRQDVAGFDADLARGNYPGAAQLAIASGQIAPDGKSNNLAWSLNAGAALVYAGEPSHAVQVLDGAEQLMTTRDVSNFGNTQYDYATYDGIMVNTYKALAFLGTGNKADARVEFNRVGDRQARAEREFAEQKAKLDAQAQRRAAGNFDLNGAIQSAGGAGRTRAIRELQTIYKPSGKLPSRDLSAQQCRYGQRFRRGAQRIEAGGGHDRSQPRGASRSCSCDSRKEGLEAIHLGRF